MGRGIDFKTEWPKIKKQLVRLSNDAMTLAKKGSEQSKLHIELTALHMKKDHMYHLLGKEYMRAKCPGTPTAQLKKFIAEINKIERDMQNLQKKAKKKTARKNTATRKKASSS